MIISVLKMIGYEQSFSKQHIFFLECKWNGFKIQDGDFLPNGDCTKMCKCDSGLLSECSTITLPPCPPQGCFPEEDYLQYTNKFSGCPPPCPACPPGRTLICHSSAFSFDIIKYAILYLSLKETLNSHSSAFSIDIVIMLYYTFLMPREPCQKYKVWE